MNELLVFDELELKPKILSQAEIEFDEKGISLLLEKFENKYSNIIIRLEDEKEFEEDNKKIKKAIEIISRFRIDTEKEIKKPLDDFVSKYKEVEKRLKTLSDNIAKQLNEFKENLFNERNEKMKEIKEKIVKELEIENLSKLISIPEQKGILTRSSYSDSKAEKIIREQVEEIQKQYKNLKTLVELESVKNGIQLNADDYILVMDNEEEVKTRIEFQVKAVRENEERIKREQEEKLRKEIGEQERKKIQKELEQKQNEIEKIQQDEKVEINEIKQEEIKKSGVNAYLKIDISTMPRPQKDSLKEFLQKNKIEYKVVIVG